MSAFIGKSGREKWLKKSAALILTVALVLSAVSGMLVFTSAEYDIWDGSSKSPSSGSGTAESPYEISTPEQLAWAVTNKDNKYYKLTADIFLNDVTVEGWYNNPGLNEWVSPSLSSPFVGHIDGDGHIVYGIWYPTGGSNETAGLIPSMKSGSVKNIGVRHSKISGKYAGGIIGYTNNGGKLDVEQCFTDETVIISGTNSASGIHGGINTNNSESKKVTISSCYTTAQISSTGAAQKVNGIIGDIWKSYIIVEDCYSYGIAPFYMGTKSTMSLAYQNDSVLTGVPLDEVIVNVFSDVAATVTGNEAYSDYYNLVASADMIGEKALTGMDGLDFNGVYKTVEGKTPKLALFPDGDIEQKPAEPSDTGAVWDGTTAAAFGSGSGTAADPYIITKGSELKLAVTSTNSKLYYRLANDIYLNDVSTTEWYSEKGNNEWISNNEFRGHLDGDGHVVFGIWYPDDKTDGYSGLISKFHSGSVKNIGVRYSHIRGSNAGGIIGYASGGNSQTIDRCFTDETVSVIGKTSASGIHGGVDSNKESDTSTKVRVVISNCYTSAVIGLPGGKTNRKVNGIIGDMWKSAVAVENCYSYGSAPYYMATASTMSLLVVNGMSIDEVLINVYSDKEAYVESNNETYLNNHTVLAAADMIGAKAAETMTGLDFSSVFETVEGKTPKLQIFPDKDPVEQVPSEPEPEEPDDGKIWNGTKAEAFENGSGTEDDPYVITRGSELLLAVTTNDKDTYYILANDIYLNDVSDIQWYKNENNNEWVKTTSFSGTLDGDGHIVYGVWYPEDTDGKATGLVSKFKTGTIKNIGVRYSCIYATQFAGGIAGYVEAGGLNTFDSCFVDETVTVGYTSTGSEVGAGGIMGFDKNDEDINAPRVEISNCYSKAALEGASSDKVNGIVGSIWKVSITVKNCYSVNSSPYYMRSTGTVSGYFWNYDKNLPEDQQKWSEGAESNIDGRVISDAVLNNYTDTKYKDTEPSSAENYSVLSRADMVGGNALESMSALDFENVYETVEKGTPKLRIFESITGEDIDTSQDAQIFSGGDGSKGNPYIIETVEQLRYLMESSDTYGKYYILANDLYINDTSDPDWKTKNPEEWYDRNDKITFSGNFDGRGHYIYGLYVNQKPTEDTSNMNNNGAALFPICDTRAVIRNVHIRDSYISGTGYVGSIIGRLKKYNDTTMAQVAGCSADSSVELHGQSTGGMVGGGNRGLDLQYCYFTGTVTSTANRGNALVGDIWSSYQRVAQCYSIGYANFRNGSNNIPSSVLVLYGTVEQNKTVVVEEEAMYGESAKSAMPKLKWDDIWYTVDGSTPHMRVIEDGDIVIFNAEGTKGQVWSGLVATKFAGGTGTEEDPYLIETPEQLAFMINKTGESAGTYYKITADIRLNDTSLPDWTSQAQEWVYSSGEWAGHLDGDGHVISGLYFNATDSVVGLFQKVVTGAVIEKLGITQSHIVSTSSSADSYAAAFIGQTIGNNSTDNKDTYVNPVISRCFADDSVYIEAKYAGGLVGGNPRALTIRNSYFTGELSGDKYAGTLIGNTWNSYVSVIENCYSVALDRDPIMENSGAANATVINSYIDGRKGKVKGIKSLGITFMKGDQAEEKMVGFDFENIWMTVEDGTPVLRCFENAENYSSHHDPYLLEMSFATEGGSECESIFGFAGQTLEPGQLPVPERRGYVFDGWYTSTYKIIPFDIDYFPDYEMVLYAKWTQIGFEQGFEGVLDELYDINSSIIHFKPGLMNYTPKYIHGGLKSIRAVSGGETEPVFLLSYENPFEVGKEYDVIFWVGATDDSSSGTIELLAASDPHVYSDTQNIKTISYDGLSANEWREFSFKFVANAPYMLVRTVSDKDLLFDDFSVVPTGKTGEVTPFNPTNDSTQQPPEDDKDNTSESTVSEPAAENTGNSGGASKPDVKTENENGNTVLIAVIIAAAAVLAATAAAVIVIAVKKRRKAR